MCYWLFVSTSWLLELFKWISLLCFIIYLKIIILWSLKFFSCDVKYLIALEYLVSQQYENLNFMEVEYYLEVCFSHQLLVLSANLFWKFGILNTQSCHIYWVALMPKEDWRLKIVLNQIDNAKEILVSIVYKLPVNLAFIVCWDSHNFEYNWYLLFLKFFSGFRGRFF